MPALTAPVTIADYRASDEERNRALVDTALFVAGGALIKAGMPVASRFGSWVAEGGLGETAATKAAAMGAAAARVGQIARMSVGDATWNVSNAILRQGTRAAEAMAGNPMGRAIAVANERVLAPLARFSTAAGNAFGRAADLTKDYFSVVNRIGNGRVTVRLRGRPSGEIASAEIGQTSGPVRRRVFQEPTETGDPHMPAGEGVTDKYGNIVYSTAGSAKDQALVLYHERVHQILSPKLSFMREFRANVGATAYDRSAFCRYLEEGLAEANAQLRVNGLRGLPDAIRFPVANDYVTVSTVLKEAAIGTIAVGGVTYGVYLAASDLHE